MIVAVGVIVGVRVTVGVRVGVAVSVAVSVGVKVSVLDAVGEGGTDDGGGVFVIREASSLPQAVSSREIPSSKKDL